jgi:outer membrane protein OmpA-like peptidoglycan-associated protein
MLQHQKISFAAAGILLIFVLSATTKIASAETTKVEGMIKARSGVTMTLHTSDARDLIVLLTDNTKVSLVKGVLKARRESMSVAALIPGLEVNVEGTLNADNQLVADSVKFNGDDLERALSVQAGMWETKAQTQQNQAELEKQQEQLAAGQKKIAANKAAIDAAAARFGQLDDYYILDEVTVYFGNGKTVLEDKYKPPLLQLAEKAKTIDGYMVQVIGYASSAGSEAVNQKLSQDRANNVSIFLSQQGYVPLVRMLAPGAMGESRQVGSDKSAEAQAQNRRVVVRILQNKAVAGSSGPGA